MPLLLALMLAAAPLKLASPGLSCANVDRAVAAAWQTHFSQQLALKGHFSVTSPEEIAQVIGLERQKQMIGCTDDSCAMELANALGVDALILGSISKGSSGFLVNLKIISAKDGSPIRVFSGRPTTEDALLDQLEQWAGEFSVTHGTAAPMQPAAPGRAGAWIAGGAAVAALGAGAALLVVAKGVDTQLVNPPADITPAAFQALKPRGELMQGLGLGLVGLGAAAAVTSVILFVVPPAAPRIGVIAGPGGAAVVLSGEFP